MNDILKQRLVGALILVALGVVFWPIIFVEPGQRMTTEAGRIPLPPSIDTTPIEPPDQDGLRASPEWVPDPGDEPEEVAPEPVDELTDPPGPTADPVADLSAPAQVPADAPATRASAPEQPTLDSKGIPVAWILQVASVSSIAKAEALRDRLLAMHEKAYVKKIERGENDLYRVYIGPNFERAQLEKIQADIDSSFGVRSMIVRYLP